MDFIEEKTPKGITLRILFKNYQFLAFDRRGESIYADKEGRSLLHNIPIILVAGRNMQLRKNYDRPYSLLRVMDGEMIFPYFDRNDKMDKYVFLSTEETVDMVPVHIIYSESFQTMAKIADATLKPAFIIIDGTIGENDAILFGSRYGVRGVIQAELANNVNVVKGKQFTEDSRVINLNMMSTNPVFLSNIHLKAMDLSKVNQLLLDFDLSALDADFILFMIQKLLNNVDTDPLVKKNIPMLKSLEDNFKFYQHLMNRDDNAIKDMIDKIDSSRNLTPYKTLLMKAMSIYPGREEQKVFSEYEKLIEEKRRVLQ